MLTWLASISDRHRINKLIVCFFWSLSIKWWRRSFPIFDQVLKLSLLQVGLAKRSLLKLATLLRIIIFNCAENTSFNLLKVLSSMISVNLIDRVQKGGHIRRAIEIRGCKVSFIGRVPRLKKFILNSLIRRDSYLTVSPSIVLRGVRDGVILETRIIVPPLALTSYSHISTLLPNLLNLSSSVTQRLAVKDFNLERFVKLLWIYGLVTPIFFFLCFELEYSRV